MSILSKLRYFIILFILPFSLASQAKEAIASQYNVLTVQDYESEILVFITLSLIFGSIILFLLKHLKRIRLSDALSRQNQYLLETIYDQSHQFMGLLNASGALASSNQTLLELIYAPTFDHSRPIWMYSGWSDATRLEVERAFSTVQDKGLVRFEAEIMHSNIGPCVLDITLKRLPSLLDGKAQYLFEAQDVTARNTTERRLIENESKLRNYYELQPVMMVTLDEHNRIQAVNAFTKQLLDYDISDMLGQKLELYYADKNEFTPRQMLSQPRHSKALVWRREVKYVTPDKRIIWIRENIRQVLETGQLLIVGEDISDAHLLAEKLEYQAHHDGLTGLYNRNHFEQELLIALQEVKGKIRSHAMLYLDLDQFKLVNDTVGHEAGDAVLMHCGNLLSGLTTERSVVARISGDEFALLIRDCEQDELLGFADQILKSFNQSEFSWQGIHINISTSIGIRVIDHTVTSHQMVHAQADTACNLAKEEGRNRAHLYRADDENFRRREMEMECVNQVYDAIANDRVDLYAQQIKDISPNASGKMHFEILVRLRDKDNILMSPAIFMPAIERYNLAHLIDREVFKKTLAWFEARPNIVKHLGRCSINLSGQSMGDNDFIMFLTDLLENTTITREKLCIEITETAAVANMQVATDLFTRLKQLGCLIALDDFGSGLSSFAYLKTLPLDIVKIDGCFVRDMHNDSKDYVVVRAMNSLAKQMGMQTVAEFVENQQILDLLVDLGVDYAQGYFFCAPIPLPRLVDQWLEEQGKQQ
ncbi:EAL domain-containing protein [Vibrio sp. S11_S32]|uniref:putative bifunctional diguanylate cyclase/phosphodiesterase n=1 Tax=Vibrio sp. S11_S32 TaxID=2720225 RepID=UPI0016804C0B|nr:EAL domain-containing protein [Vibrio sp. S11_S32]MBD1575791.1 EAL domain-containing protein [Vibrio sp. S11_S32]